MMKIKQLYSNKNCVWLCKENHNFFIWKHYKGKGATTRAMNEIGGFRCYNEIVDRDLLPLDSKITMDPDASADVWYPFIEGTPLGTALGNTPSYVKVLDGERATRMILNALKSLWSVHVDVCGYYLFATQFASLHSEWFSFLIADIQNQFNRLNASLTLSKSIKSQLWLELQSLRRSIVDLANPDGFCVCQTDPIYDNCLVDIQANRTCLIDFEYATGAVPAWDIGRWLLNTAIHYPEVRDDARKECVRFADEHDIRRFDITWYSHYYLCQLANIGLVSHVDWDVFHEFTIL